MNSDNVPSTQWIPALLTMLSAHLDPIIKVSSKETNWISAGICNWKLASNDALWPCCERSLDINQASLCLLWQIGLCCALRYQHYQGHQIYLGPQSCLIQFQSQCNLEASKFLHRFSNFCLMFTGFMLSDSLFLWTCDCFTARRLHLHKHLWPQAQNMECTRLCAVMSDHYTLTHTIKGTCVHSGR